MNEVLFRDIGYADLEPVSCYIKKFTPEFYMGMHNHAYFEMMYAAKGNFLLEAVPLGAEPSSQEEINNVLVRQGELVFLDAGVFHRLRIEEGEVVIYNVELQATPARKFEPSHISNLCPINYSALIACTGLKKLSGSPQGYTVVPNLSRIDSSLRELIISILRNSPGVEEACCLRSQILLLLMEIAKSLTLLEQDNIHYVRKIFLYIKHHLNQKISLDDIAKTVGYHKSYIASQFKKYTGRTIMQTVNEMRISRSLRLLRDTSFPVAEISRRVGFPSYAQMIHEFNKTLKLSPSACRKLFLNDEFDYSAPQYSSLAIRIDEEDFLLNDETFQNSFYKKNINSPATIALMGY